MRWQRSRLNCVFQSGKAAAAFMLNVMHEPLRRLRMHLELPSAIRKLHNGGSGIWPYF
jgi:hypothetical protein